MVKIKAILISFFKNKKDKYKRSSLDIIEDQIRLECYWKSKVRKTGCCKIHTSMDAYMNYGIPYESINNALIGHIEHLESELAKLNESK